MQATSGGLVASARNSAATLLQIGRTRLELVGNELKDEKLRAVRLLLLAQAMAFCVLVGTILGVALLVLLFWEQRVGVLGGCCALFFLLAGVSGVAVRRAHSSPHPLFAASIAELGHDLAHLRGKAGDESKTD